ncbi:MAG: hypothetical protein IKB52_04215 [Kiritimatiellae bacterium]|nr:hypothetical protein [Kiritimatiellia bacterium]
MALGVEELLLLHADAGGVDFAAGLDVALQAAVGLSSNDVVEKLVHLGRGDLGLGRRRFRSGLFRGRLFSRLFGGRLLRRLGRRLFRWRGLFGSRLFRWRELFGSRLFRGGRLFGWRRSFFGGGLCFRGLLLRRCRRLLCGRFGWWLCFRGLRGSILGGRIIRLEVVQQRVEIVLRRCEPGTGDKGDGRAQSENFFHVRHCYCLFLG